MAHIFINYRRQDTEGYVGRLYDHLAQRFAADELFMDVNSIEPGQDFVQALDEAVAACDVFIAMIGPHWLTLTDGDSGERRLDQWNDYVRLEIESALKQDKLIIPILVGQARMPSSDELPEVIAALARRNAIELSHQRFAYDVENLLNVISAAFPANPAAKTQRDPEALRHKEAALKDVRDELMYARNSPLYKHRIENRHFPVLGEGHPDANIMFIGEAPGKFEAERGKPFSGPSGDILDDMLASIALERDAIYMTNILLDCTPTKREPTPEEIAFYSPFVERLIEIIEPGVIVPLGRFAMQYILKKFDLPEQREKISQLHGKLLDARAAYGDIYVVPLYHPAVVLYSASRKETLRKDFEKLKLFV